MPPHQGSTAAQIKIDQAAREATWRMRRAGRQGERKHGSQACSPRLGPDPTANRFDQGASDGQPDADRPLACASCPPDRSARRPALGRHSCEADAGVAEPELSCAAGTAHGQVRRHLVEVRVLGGRSSGGRSLPGLPGLDRPSLALNSQGHQRAVPIQSANVPDIRSTAAKI